MTEFQPIEFGKYTLLHRLATGGMAELYLSKLTGAEGFEKLIAIKKILPHLLDEKDFVDSFIAEAKLAAFLQHPNIVQIYDFGSMDDNYFIAMEYLSGRDLKNVIGKSGQAGSPIDLDMALYITGRICSGLDYAHDLKDFYGNHLNIIHRDISPQNIFVTYDGLVKIIDFGIAKAAGRSTTTQMGSIKGKIAYMSPEQAGGQAIDYRSDIYAVGILLYEMVTHSKMFAGDTFEIFPKVRNAEFTPPEKIVEDIPPAVVNILHRALEKDPDSRYQSAGEMQTDLEQCMAELDRRPNSRALTQFMGDLFLDETVADRTALVSAMTGAEKTAENKAPGQDTDALDRDASVYEKTDEKTEIMSRIHAPLPPKKKRFPIAVAVIGGLMAGLVVVFIFMFGKKPVSQTKNNLSQSSGKQATGLVGGKRATGSDALLNSAVGLMKSDPSRAYNLLKKCVAIDPGNAEAYFRLGVLSSRRKAYPDAIEFYKKAVKIDSEFSVAFFNLGYIYATESRYEEAEKMYHRVVDLRPGFLDEALFNLAMVEVRLGKKAAGIKNLERAIAINPKNRAIATYLNRLKNKS
ncbi:MAG: protein kinase [Deltaproteobacteria bacterium]|nr:protein kinase [Deltaproteobacteria bacterium]